MAAIESALEKAGARRRGRGVLPRHDGRDQCAARGARRADSVRRHRGLHRPRRARPTGSAAALPAVRRAPGAARARRAPLRRARADDPGRPAHASYNRSGARACRASRRGGARGGRGRAAALLPPPGARAGSAKRWRERSRMPTSRSRTRSWARSASSSAPPPPRSTPRCRRCWPAICANSSERASEAGLPEPAIMQSNGGLIDAEAAAGHASWTVLSGPAGGAAGAAFVARQAGARGRAVLRHGRDLVRRVRGRRRQRAGAQQRRDRRPPAGAADARGPHGRRRRRLDRLARRRRRAARRPPLGGRRPGPACYGRGGTEPTVTDANLVLGYLSADAPLGGGVELDRDAAESARSATRGAARPRRCTSAPRASAGSPTPR